MGLLVGHFACTTTSQTWQCRHWKIWMMMVLLQTHLQRNNSESRNTDSTCTWRNLLKPNSCAPWKRSSLHWDALKYSELHKLNYKINWSTNANEGIICWYSYQQFAKFQLRAVYTEERCSLPCFSADALTEFCLHIHIVKFDQLPSNKINCTFFFSSSSSHHRKVLETHPAKTPLWPAGPGQCPCPVLGTAEAPLKLCPVL